MSKKTNSVEQALDVFEYFLDHVFAPAVKSPKNWGKENIVLWPLTLVILVLSIASAIITIPYLCTQKPPTNPGDLIDFKKRNSNFYINASINNVGVFLAPLVTVIALIFIYCIIKPIVKSCNKIVAKDEALDSYPRGEEVGQSVYINPEKSEELERNEQDTDDPLAANGSSLFVSDSHTNENDSLLPNDAEGRECSI